ncbi:HU family DNA-binding protein [Geoalkalibacter subterraneus]|uniref:DNA-binding protein n=1 Tax=Geoalkalibacter subterraneus TaxID=483547 RepID=A0A0B5FX14_9BACT|nr:HU family DNA-binding protein [Geoalkalibacter subterraneus]AJF08141.1 hypothetical protein GSUB_16675 [Geoalkalibacter subterraneus]
MTKEDLIKGISEKAGVTKADAGKTIKAIEMIVLEKLQNDEKALLPGIGTFVVKERKARKGRNPATGESIDIPAAKYVGFKPLKNIREALND